jgi:hypothetical protein
MESKECHYLWRSFGRMECCRYRRRFMEHLNEVKRVAPDIHIYCIMFTALEATCGRKDTIFQEMDTTGVT